MDYIQLMQIRFVKSLYRSCLLHFELQKRKKYIFNKRKEVKGIKIHLDIIFNNFPVHLTGLQLVLLLKQKPLGSDGNSYVPPGQKNN